jgi:hypothetical protein
MQGRRRNQSGLVLDTINDAGQSFTPPPKLEGRDRTRDGKYLSRRFPKLAPPLTTIDDPLRSSLNPATTAMLPTPISRFLIPRGYAALRVTALPFPQHTIVRHASAAAGKAKDTPTLAQPDKYRPPSHGRSVPRSITEQRSYGPKLTKEEKERMAKKKYPNMMPPKGTFMYWFLHNKELHIYISFVCTKD